MIGALNYKNNHRSLSGKEEFRTKWFEDINALNWSTPFFRHVDGQDHTHFFIDIDVRLVSKAVKKQYQFYPDRLRALKLEAVIEYFRKWQLDYGGHKFLWKVSGTGLHAIQRIDRKIDRRRLIPVVLHLFPPAKRIRSKLTLSAPKNDIHVKPLSAGERTIYLRPTLKDDGWCLDYDEKEKNYIKRNWVRLWEYKGVVFKFILDLNFFYNATRIVRWTYSPYFNIPGRIYYSTPITTWDVEKVLEESVYEGLKINKYLIPEFSFRQMIDWEDTVDDELWIQRRARGTKTSGIVVTPYQIHLHDVEDILPVSYEHKLDEMSDSFIQGVGRVPPCMEAHYRRSLTKGVGGHWSRFLTGRYLRAFGYSIEDIANWYRFRINDEDDNLPENRGALLNYLPHVLGPEDEPHRMPSCSIIQDPSHEYFVCDEEMQNECGRRHPLSKRPRKEEIKPIAEVDRPSQFTGERERKTYWTAIKNLIRNAFTLDDNLVVWKATRAGVTTTMIRIASEMGKKMLVVVPTNRIGEVTFPDAMKIVKEDTDEVVNGAILASNRKGCLLLNFVERGLIEMKKRSPDWGDPTIAWTRLRYHSRPDCSTCSHNQAIVSVPILDKEGNPQPLNKSHILDYDRRTGYCAYITFREHIEEFDVIFVTYAKLYSLMVSGSTDSEDLRDDLFGYFDIVLLDEVSTFANRSPIDLTVLKHPNLLERLDETAKVDLFAQIRHEVDLLSNYTTSRTAHEMIGWCNRFIANFEYLKLKQWKRDNPTLMVVQERDETDMEVLSHPLSYYERNQLRADFNKVHGVLDNYTRNENRILGTMEDILLLMTEESWIVVNTPSPTRALELRFVSAPKTAEVKAFIRRFGGSRNNKHVFATDACMPEVNLSEFFNLNFKDFVVGDPRKTNKNQLIIADTRQIGVIRFSISMKCVDSKCSYWQNDECTLNHKFIGRDPTDDYNIKERVLKAHYKERCYRYQIEFLKECSAIVRMYSPENVIVVLPNRDIYYWFIERIKWGAVPKGIDVTYYRSDKTLGVPCDRRIMICLSMPFTPNGSHLWLAHYYRQDNLLMDIPMWDLAAKLRLNSCKQAFWQTIGRAKSPVGKTRSVVIAWGISEKGMSTLFDFNEDYMKDSLPFIFYPPKRGHDERTNYIIGRFWRTYGAVPDPALLRLSQLVQSLVWMGRWIKHSEIKRFGGLEQTDIERLATYYDEEMFGHLGVEVKVGRWGAFTKLDARSLTTNTEHIFINE